MVEAKQRQMCIRDRVVKQVRYPQSQCSRSRKSPIQRKRARRQQSKSKVGFGIQKKQLAAGN